MVAISLDNCIHVATNKVISFKGIPAQVLLVLFHEYLYWLHQIMTLDQNNELLYVFVHSRGRQRIIYTTAHPQDEKTSFILFYETSAVFLQAFLLNIQ